ncbi:type II toxin-antitoxin system VapC family toxin [Zavarzinia compransoris]|uniref:PIN domain nuclease n=1 Tax=Zavarzinia compransoris TaxID=1264899 RepID=A0A317EBS7_9PROT|nr:type II toxin-antitoxin system VapC family toxin [Zavarzinia compransoris]PWR23744.1 PIN domain nuclease [Zavarzinia compransoris]TDP47971.1 PIN domain nuclease of toxin-antitoxin system [Zavarzinia compransoris]
MSALLLDTHAWAWSLNGSDRLSGPALAAMTRTATILVSPVSFFEIAQKVRLGKWPAMAPHVGDLPALLERQGARPAPLGPEICTRAGMMAWEHRDPFDRLIAATAILLGIPLVSADPVFDGIAPRLW